MANVPREAALDLFLGSWRRIKGRQTRPITMRRGRMDWASDVSPTSCSILWDNTSGDLNPDNPNGQYYGLLGQNTPMRFGYVLLRDTFSRTVASGWGSSTPDGIAGHSTTSLTWTQIGAIQTFSVGGGVGSVSAPVNTANHMYLTSLGVGMTHRVIDVCADVTIPTGASSNNLIAVCFHGNATTITAWCCVEVQVTSAGVVRVQAREFGMNTVLAGPTVVAGVVASGTIRVRAQVEAQTLRIKAWNPSGTDPNMGEPFDWNAVGHTSLSPERGWVSLRFEQGTGNGTQVYTVDNVVVTSWRHWSYTSSITPRTDTTGQDRYVEITASGVLRRMERNTANPRSAPRVYIPTTAAVAYWPMEGGTLTTAIQPAVGKETLQLGNNSGTLQAGSQYFGKGALGPFLSPGLTLRGGGDFVGGLVQMPNFVDKWVVDHVHAGGIGFTTSLTVNMLSATAGASLTFTVTFNGATKDVTITNPSGGSFAVNIPLIFDGAAHHIRFFCAQAGGAVNVILDVDANNLMSGGGFWTGTLGPVYSTYLTDSGPANHNEALALAHLTVYAEGRPQVNFANPVLGWNGESAGRRIQRLCSENGIPFGWIGDLDSTLPMGPQRPLPVRQLLAECAETDQGTLVESRTSTGLIYRTGRSHYSQSAALTLVHSGGQLAEPLDMRRDDQGIQNRVTVRRVEGSDYVATQTSGPLNVNDPGVDPQGVGVYDANVTVNTSTDDLLQQVAGWLLHMGTATDTRIGSVVVQAASANLSLQQDYDLLSLDVDDQIAITRMASQQRTEPLTQLARGVTETLDTVFSNQLSFVAAPAAPYLVPNWDDTNARWDSDTTTLVSGISSSATSFSAAVADGYLWTTTPGDFPFDVMVAGERMTVTAISGASSPQTWTVTRSVPSDGPGSGVVKAQAAGAKVQLYQPSYWGL